MTTNPSAIADDRAAVAAVPQRIVAAWADHDAGAFARAFTEDGTLIITGVSRTGRQEIESFMAQAFTGPFKGTQVTGTPYAVKPLAENVVLVLTQGGVLAPGETEVAAERAIRASWLLVKQDGEWLITAYQNTPVQAA
ncbi:SgcJ/EcaC family oxidoreductase [Micromonospora sp. NPDC048999]|uniref:SgcJ/EcaC family oxidoreductase n=1 Tax=Micromonospora sp. NPDC048999 TaxID=3155391 RepID=UPI0033C9AC86